MKRILVTGSRTWEDATLIGKQLIQARQDMITEPGEIVMVVHGGARGADLMAERFVRQHPELFEQEVHAADWNRFGKRAGFLRNAYMVNLGADVCLAFIRDESPGATMCARLAREAGIPTVTFTNTGVTRHEWIRGLRATHAWYDEALHMPIE